MRGGIVNSSSPLSVMDNPLYFWRNASLLRDVLLNSIVYFGFIHHLRRSLAFLQYYLCRYDRGETFTFYGNERVFFVALLTSFFHYFERKRWSFSVLNFPICWVSKPGLFVEILLFDITLMIALN